MLRKRICAGLLALSSVYIMAASAGPLHDAIEKGDTAKVKQMLADKNVDLKKTNKHGFLPLQLLSPEGASALQVQTNQRGVILAVTIVAVHP